MGRIRAHDDRLQQACCSGVAHVEDVEGGSHQHASLATRAADAVLEHPLLRAEGTWISGVERAVDLRSSQSHARHWRACDWQGPEWTVGPTRRRRVPCRFSLHVNKKGQTPYVHDALHRETTPLCTVLVVRLIKLYGECEGLASDTCRLDSTDS